MSRPLIVLDIDHTLVYTCSVSIPVFDRFVLRVGAEENVFCHVRPNAPQLLRYLVQRVVRGEVDFGFWSTGTRDYVVEIVNKLFEIAGIPNDLDKVHFLFSREVTPFTGSGDFVKVLDMLDRKECLLVDDNSLHATVPSNYGKILLIPPFHGASDTVIVTLMYTMDYRFGWMPLTHV